MTKQPAKIVQKWVCGVNWRNGAEVAQVSVKETEKMYRIVDMNFRHLVGYLSNICKESNLVHDTREQAINAEMARQECKVKHLMVQLEREEARLNSIKKLLTEGN